MISLPCSCGGGSPCSGCGPCCCGGGGTKYGSGPCSCVGGGPYSGCGCCGCSIRTTSRSWSVISGRSSWISVRIFNSCGRWGVGVVGLFGDCCVWRCLVASCFTYSGHPEKFAGCAPPQFIQEGGSMGSFLHSSVECCCRHLTHLAGRPQYCDECPYVCVFVYAMLLAFILSKFFWLTIVLLN